ncbi:MAG: TerD family protein [bacterium]|nr:TerD family protein [bacterium]
MSTKLAKGSKADITKGRPQLRQLIIGLGWQSSLNLDSAAFLLNANRKVAAEEDFVFYGNMRHRSGSVEHLGDKLISNSGDDTEEIRVDLDTVPAAVERIAFTLTLYDDKSAQPSFAQVRSAYIRIMNAANGQEILRYDLNGQLSSETAIVIGELYRYKGEWKFSVIDSGFNGGLAALCQSFGIIVCDDEATPETQPEVQPAPLFQASPLAMPLAAAERPSAPAVQYAQPAPQRLSISPNSVPNIPNEPQIIPLVAEDSHRVQRLQPVVPRQNIVAPPALSALSYTLAPLSLSAVEVNKGERIGLATREKSIGDITIKFHWNNPQQEKYSLSCFYELKDGSKDIIQILGNQVGCFDQPPYIVLEEGNYTANTKDEDTIRINGAMLAEIKKIFVFTSNFAYLQNWYGSNGELIISYSGGPSLVIRLNEFVPSQRHCVIASLTNENDTTFSVERIIRFFNMMQEIDQALDWKLPWCTKS